MFQRSVFVFVQAALLSLAFTSDATSDIIRVDHESTATTPDGSTWALSFDDLQDALDYAEFLGGAHDLWIADGTYTPTVETNPRNPQSVTFTMLPDVKIFGGFQGISRPGGGETLLSQRKPDTYETILNGELGDPGQTNDNAQIVVTADGTGITATSRLNGVTVRNASFSGLFVKDGAAPAVIRCTITNNTGLSGSAVTCPQVMYQSL